MLFRPKIRGHGPRKFRPRRDELYESMAALLLISGGICEAPDAFGRFRRFHDWNLFWISPRKRLAACDMAGQRGGASGGRASALVGQGMGQWLARFLSRTLEPRTGRQTREAELTVMYEFIDDSVRRCGFARTGGRRTG